MQYPIAFPRTPSSQKLVLNRRQAAGQSPFSFAQQVVDGAAQWALQWTWPTMNARAAELVAAWLDSLKGQVGTFTYSPRQAQLSTLTGITLSGSGFAFSNSVILTGWTANAPSTLRVGQLFQLGTQLLRLTAAAHDADASGKVTVEFEPSLRAAMATGTAAEFVNPLIEMHLATSDGQSFSVNTDRACDFGTLTAVEAI